MPKVFFILSFILSIVVFIRQPSLPNFASVVATGAEVIRPDAAPADQSTSAAVIEQMSSRISQLESQLTRRESGSVSEPPRIARAVPVPTPIPEPPREQPIPKYIPRQTAPEPTRKAVITLNVGGSGQHISVYHDRQCRNYQPHSISGAGRHLEIPIPTDACLRIGLSGAGNVVTVCCDDMIESRRISGAGNQLFVSGN